ncbi:uncharacterized protein LOC144474133 isoform X1 [Augochlora pura]
MAERFVVVAVFSLAIFLVTANPRPQWDNDRLKPYHDSVMHRFYGPWSTLRKRNGDYVDYNDYGGRIPDFLPASPDITRDGPPLLGNPHGAPANYGERPAMFNLDDKWRTVGLADFRTGIRSDSGSAAKVN